MTIRLMDRLAGIMLEKKRKLHIVYDTVDIHNIIMDLIKLNWHLNSRRDGPFIHLFWLVLYL